MNEEVKSLEKKKMWNLEELPNERKAIGFKMVFKKKKNVEEKVEKYKVFLFFKSYSQAEGIEYDEILFFWGELTLIRCLLFMVIAFDLEIEKMHVKLAFLHGKLDEEIYMKQLEGFVEIGKDNLIYKLKKSLYGLK